VLRRIPPLDLLLRHGGKIDEAFDHTKPILNELVRWGQFKQARLMLARGASPNIADERGWTAIHRRVSRGNVKMLRELLAAGGDATRRDKEGFTPADIARFKLRRDLLALL
jgi:ankyrin repeat protein